MIHARNFAPLYDIDEEAATGTSNGALVYYLYRHGLVEPDKVYTVVQGEKMGRPSMISAQVILKDSQPFVKVGRDVGPGRDRAVKAKLCYKEGAGWAELPPFVGQYGILLRLAVPDEGLPADAERKRHYTRYVS